MNQTTTGTTSKEALFVGFAHEMPVDDESPESSLAHPYAAELAQLYRSIADTLDFYASADAPNHLNRKARKTDIRITKLRLGELERRCQAWLDVFLSEGDEAP